MRSVEAFNIVNSVCKWALQKGGMPDYDHAVKVAQALAVVGAACEQTDKTNDNGLQRSNELSAAGHSEQ